MPEAAFNADIDAALKAAFKKAVVYRNTTMKAAATEALAAWLAVSSKPPIPDNLTGTFPLQSKVELPSSAGASILSIESVLIQIAEISAGALKTVQAVREGLDAGSKGGPDPAEPERTRVKELKRRHLGDAAPAKPAQSKKRPPDDEGKRREA